MESNLLMTDARPITREFLSKLKHQLVLLDAVDKHLLVGFSGGADSTTLLDSLSRVREDCRIQITAAHLNHRMRETESATDAKWVNIFAGKRHVPIVIENWMHNRNPSDGGFEEAARDARYDFFQRTASQLNCDCVALAHTADDQAETILHHVLRGTGLAGLRGMPASRELQTGIRLIRPMLTCSRETILQYLHSAGIEYRIDVTNADTQWTRNRIRHTLLPLLQQQFNPNVKQALLRLGQQAEQTQDAIQSWTRLILSDAILDQQPETVRIQIDELDQYPLHLIRECLKQIWKSQHWPRKQMGYDKWADLAAIVTAPNTNAELHLPGGLIANRRDNLLVLTMRE